MKAILTTILAMMFVVINAQQKEIIRCPKSASVSTDPVTQYFMYQLENEFMGYEVLDENTMQAKIINPEKPMNFRLNNDYLLFAHSLGCWTSGVVYYVIIKPEALNYSVPDGVTTGNPLFKDWLKNLQEWSDTTIYANIPDSKGFLTHEQAVSLAYYFEVTGNGRLINIKEYNELKPEDTEMDLW